LDPYEPEQPAESGSGRAGVKKCTAPPGLDQFQYDVWESTNSYRTSYGLGCLQWDASLATYMRQYLKHQDTKGGCRMVHSPRAWRQQVGSFQNPGENLYSRYGTSDDPTGARVAEAWFNEVYCYRYGPVGSSCTKSWSPTCSAKNLDWRASQVEVGHFTQLMWDKATHVGCVIHKCGQGYNGQGDKWLAGCSYGSSITWYGGNLQGSYPFEHKVAGKLGLQQCG